MDENPDTKLTEFITQMPDDDARDTAMDISTPEMMHNQLHIRILGEEWGYDLPFFFHLANTIEKESLSYKRQSRQEAVQGLHAKTAHDSNIYGGKQPDYLIEEMAVDDK